MTAKKKKFRHDMSAPECGHYDGLGALAEAEWEFSCALATALDKLEYVHRGHQVNDKRKLEQAETVRKLIKEIRQDHDDNYDYSKGGPKDINLFPQAV